jgi:hypothetical protein
VLTKGSPRLDVVDEPYARQVPGHTQSEASQHCPSTNSPILSPLPNPILYLGIPCALVELIE